MKKVFLNIVAVAAIVAVSLVSCKKEEAKPTEVVVDSSEVVVDSLAVVVDSTVVTPVTEEVVAPVTEEVKAEGTAAPVEAKK